MLELSGPQDLWQIERVELVWWALDWLLWNLLNLLLVMTAFAVKVVESSVLQQLTILHLYWMNGYLHVDLYVSSLKLVLLLAVFLIFFHAWLVLLEIKYFWVAWIIDNTRDNAWIN